MVGHLSHRKHQNANGYGEIHLPVERDVSDRAAVWTTGDTLEICDDFHRPDLRGSGNRTRWKRRPHDITGSDSLPKLPGHDGYEMMYRGPRLELEQARYPDRTGQADPGQVVSEQIYDHQVLSPVLFARQELRGECLVRFGVCSPWPSTLDRSGLDSSGTIHLQEALR